MLRPVLFVVVLVCLLSCGGGGGSSDSGGSVTAKSIISPEVFGVNLRWPYLGDGIVRGGELVRDRAFRIEQPVGTKKYWLPIATGAASTTFQANENESYAQLQTTTQGELACVYHQLLDGVRSGENYDVTFTSYGVGAERTIAIYLVDENYSSLLSVPNLEFTSGADMWKVHTIAVNPSLSSSMALLGVCKQGSGGGVNVKDIRMSENGAFPAVKSLVKERMQSLGVKSLRWPGGTYADTFVWQESVGALEARSEQAVYEGGEIVDYQTVSLGLHEFLDLCESLAVEPVITVNVNQDVASAEALIEYILGDASTTQGALRAQNGRANPWEVRYFEIGNEPSLSYQGGGVVQNIGASYAQQALLSIDAMQSKARAIGNSIHVAGIVESSFHMADWLSSSHPLETVQMLANWNQQVFDSVAGISNSVDAVNSHFYSYFSFHADEQTRFEHLMSAGALFDQTLIDLRSVSEKPFWVTEYQAIVEQNG